MTVSPVIFLDFDGVLNNGVGGLNPHLVNRVSQLAWFASAEIVITSSWRDEYDIEQLRDFLYEAEFYRAVQIVGVTPSLTKTTPGQLIVTAKTRWDEIKAYLVEHPEITSWVILDDACTGYPPKDRYVETKGEGITWEDCGRARDILETPCLLVDYL